MKRILIIFFLFCSVTFAQDFFVPMLWKLDGLGLVPTNAAYRVPATYLNGQLPALDGSLLTGIGFVPSTTAELMEDFVGGNTTSGNIGNYGWKFVTWTDGVVTYDASVSGRVAIIKITSGTTEGNGSTLFLVDAANQPILPNALGNTTAIFSVKQTAANSTQNMQIGFADNIALIGDVNNGSYFRFTGSGNWNAVTRRGGLETVTDTGVLQSTSFKLFKIITNSTGTSTAFYIDDVLKATHTTNLPNGAISPRIQIVTTATDDKSFSIDYFYLKVTGLTR